MAPSRKQMRASLAGERYTFDPPLRRCCNNGQIMAAAGAGSGWGEIRCPTHGYLWRRAKRGD